MLVLVFTRTAWRLIQVAFPDSSDYHVVFTRVFMVKFSYPGLPAINESDSLITTASLPESTEECEISVQNLDTRVIFLHNINFVGTGIKCYISRN